MLARSTANQLLNLLVWAEGRSAKPAPDQCLSWFMYFLHSFQKKSRRGIATPKEDMDIVLARLKMAEAFATELRK